MGLEVLNAFIEYTVQIARSQMASTDKYRTLNAAGPTYVAIPGMWTPETVPAGKGAPEGDVFGEQKARRDATNNFALAWLNWEKLAASIEWRQQEYAPSGRLCC
jgi:hypothetical protein